MSNADKRSVHTDALETLGTIIGPNEGRDAIHLAVENVEAGMNLRPGDHVYRAPNGKYYWAQVNTGLGIVDPFLSDTVLMGQRFWLVVYPRKITSLRHVWTHPDFDDLPQDLPKDSVNVETAVEASRRWIEEYASSLGDGDIEYEDLMYYAETWCNPDLVYSGEYLIKGGSLEGESTNPEFWKHFTIVTGKSPVENKYYGTTPSFFSCSC